MREPVLLKSGAWRAPPSHNIELRVTLEIIMRAVIFLLLLLPTLPLEAELVHIAAATNFKLTAEKINALFEVETPHRATLSSASTGVLYNQIIHGAPFDIFFSADVNSAERLGEEGYGTADSHFCYALGELVLMGSGNVARDLTDPSLSLAIANPQTAPYGRAALEVIQRPEFIGARQRKLVRANNAAQAYQHWHSSAVDLALVPRSLARNRGTAITPSWYTGIEQHVILLKNSGDNPAAKTYMRWIRSEQVQALITEAGYGPCP